MGSAEQKTGLAVVTGTLSGKGLELAKIAASKGYDVIIAADEGEIKDTASEPRRIGANVDAVVTDLSIVEGVERLAESIEVDGRFVDLPLANAGR